MHMKVGLIADLHNNLENWKKIKELLAWQGAKELVVAGDITDSPMLDRMAADFRGLIHVVFGNMDQQTDLMEILAHRYANLRIYGFHGEFVIAKQKFVVNHYEQETKDRIKGEQKVVLVCGHTHEKKEERTQHYLLVNPGTAGGVFQKASFAVYDMNNEQLNFIDL